MHETLAIHSCTLLRFTVQFYHACSVLSTFRAGIHPPGARHDGLLGAYQRAQMAAHAFFAVQPWAALGVHFDRLMPAVPAGDHAPAAADAALAQKARIDHAVALQGVRGGAYAVKAQAHRL